MNLEQTQFQEHDHKVRRRRKLRESAILLPVLGIALLLTPLISSFSKSDETLNVPFGVVYIFGVWVVLILLAALLSRSLSKRDDD